MPRVPYDEQAEHNFRVSLLWLAAAYIVCVAGGVALEMYLNG
jgi:hypothetical protein